MVICKAKNVSLENTIRTVIDSFFEGYILKNKKNHSIMFHSLLLFLTTNLVLVYIAELFCLDFFRDLSSLLSSHLMSSWVVAFIEVVSYCLKAHSQISSYLYEQVFCI